MGILGIILFGLSAIAGLVGFVFFIIILVHAFKVDTGQGFLCLCVPFYILYFAFVTFQHPKKTQIVAVWLGAYVLQGALYGVAALTLIGAAGDALQEAHIEAQRARALQGPAPMPVAPAGQIPTVVPTTPFAPAIPVAPMAPSIPVTPMAPVPMTPTPAPAPGLTPIAQ